VAALETLAAFETLIAFDTLAALDTLIALDTLAALDTLSAFDMLEALDRLASFDIFAAFMARKLALTLPETEGEGAGLVALSGADFLLELRLLIRDFFWIAMVVDSPR
jgi:hypothetical protein